MTSAAVETTFAMSLRPADATFQDVETTVSTVEVARFFPPSITAPTEAHPTNKNSVANTENNVFIIFSH